MANTELQRTQSGTETDSKKATISVWLKLSAVEGNYAMGVFGSHVSGDYNANGNAQVGFYNGGLYAWWKTGGSSYYKQESTRRFRDTNAWYHVVYRYDTTQSSGDDRIRVYVNGEEITSWVAVNDPPQNANIEINNGGRIIRVGTYNYLDGTPNYFNGSMSHYHFCDGYSYAPTEFGSTDSTTGEWIINTSPSVSYGTNGFTILKDGNTITDQSSNSNDFSAGAGTLTKTEDCPSNVFCTWNPLNSYYGGGTFSWGNNKIVLPNKNGAWNTGTLGMTSGKYYWEVKVGGDNNGTEVQVGIADKSPVGNQGSTAGKAFGYSSNGEYGIYAWNGGFIGNAVSNPYTSYGSASGDGYIMIAVDLDNNKFYGGLNGTWFASGNPSTGTNGKTIQAVANTVDGVYYPAVSTFEGYSGTVETNFGNGYFADNAVSSAGTNASGNGIFKYDVPTGYTALSTKGLNL